MKTDLEILQEKRAKLIEEGKVMYHELDELAISKIEDLINQPTSGLLYDLNRDYGTVATVFPDNLKVNEIAFIDVFCYMHKRLRELEKKNDEDKDSCPQ